jgi:hypothetical protein
MKPTTILANKAETPNREAAPIVVKRTPNMTMSIASRRRAWRAIDFKAIPARIPKRREMPISATASPNIIIEVVVSGLIRTCAAVAAKEKMMIARPSSSAMIPSKVLVKGPLAFNSVIIASTVAGAVATEMAPITRAMGR